MKLCAAYFNPALRAVAAGLLTSQTLATASARMVVADKWQVMNELRGARAHCGISSRDLAVMNAMIRFLSGREMAGGADRIVFPSNATLSDRAHGMAESTLRRHWATLAESGRIARHDSPNGKHYVTRGRGGELWLLAETPAGAGQRRRRGHRCSAGRG